MRKLKAALYLRWRYIRTLSMASWIFAIALVVAGIMLNHYVLNPVHYERVWVTAHSGDSYWSLCEQYGNDPEVRNTMAVSSEENLKAGTDLNNIQSGETIVIYRRVAN